MSTPKVKTLKTLINEREGSPYTPINESIPQWSPSKRLDKIDTNIDEEIRKETTRKWAKKHEEMREQATKEGKTHWRNILAKGKTRKMPETDEISPNLYTPKSLSKESGLFEDEESYELDESIQNIAVLTSGGDSCGMNAAVRAIVRASIKLNLKCYLIHDGYYGLINDDIEDATWESVGSIMQQGGTILGTARCSAFRKVEGRREAVKNLLKRNVNGLVIIGGDGSLTGASILANEWKEHSRVLVEENEVTQKEADDCASLKFVGLVGSIDNDMKGTLNTIGADSALHRICEAIDHIATTASSHKRAFVIEVMGRDCGYLAIMSALVTGVDYCFIPEDPPKKGWELDMCAAIKAGREKGKKCTVVIVCEGAKSYTGKKITSDYVKDVLEFHLDLTARVSILGHIQRGGTPSAYDRYLSTATGVEAVRVLLNKKIEVPQLIGMSGYTLTRADLMKCVEQNKVAENYLQKQNYVEIIKAKGQRFSNAVDLYRVMKQPSPIRTNPNPIKMGLMSVGAPAPGMNSFFRFLTRLMLNEGHNVVGIQEGFRGFAKGKVIEMDWMTVNGWASYGGCMLGTCRDTPKTDEILDQLENVIESQQLNTVVMVGGFEAYRSVILIDEAIKRDRQRWRALASIRWFIAPATISNNVPFTTASLGCDKALNNMMLATDNIKQSSIGYCNRVFLVQVMGGYCGFLAQMGALIVGAEGVFTHEKGISLENLIQVVQHTRKRCSGEDEPKLALYVNNERSDKYYNLNVLKAFFDKETDKSTSVRTSELGSLQQGGNPSPLDRILAGEFAYEIFNYLNAPDDYALENESNFFFLGVNQEEVSFFNDVENLKLVIDDTFRRPKDQWWIDPLNDIMEMVSKY